MHACQRPSTLRLRLRLCLCRPIVLPLRSLPPSPTSPPSAPPSLLQSLEAVFTAVSAIFKHLVRHLAADLPAALRVSAPLRYHSADYVRQFAAQAVGFLLRAAPTPAALRAGVRTVLAEQAARPSPERTDGAGEGGEVGGGRWEGGGGVFCPGPTK